MRRALFALTCVLALGHPCFALGFSVAERPNVKVCDGNKLVSPCRYFVGDVLDLRNYQWSNGHTMNDDITSLQVSSGKSVTVCTGIKLGGTCLDLGPNSPGYYWDLAKRGYGSKISSFAVQKSHTRLFGSWSFLSNHPGGSTSSRRGREFAGRENDWSDNAQGVTNDGTYWYITDEEKLYKYDIKQSISSNIYMKRIGLPFGCGHFGDLSYYDGYLYVAVSECPENYGRPGGLKYSKARIFVYDQNLNLVKQANLRTANGRNRRDVGWVAVNPTNGYLYTSDSNSTRMQVYARTGWSSGAFLSPLYQMTIYDREKKTLVLDTVQGGVFSPNGYLYVVNDNYYHRKHKPGIYIFKIRGPQAKLVRKIGLAYTYKYAHVCNGTLCNGLGSELEGITLWDLDADRRARGIDGGQIHVIMVDNDSDQDDVFMRHLRVDNVERL